MSAVRKANAYWGLHFTKEIASKTTAFKRNVALKLP